MEYQEFTTAESIDCNSCGEKIGEYVQLELEGQDAERIYPDVSFHIETCDECEIAYYQEFRAQADKKSLQDLRILGERPLVASVLERMVPPTSLLLPESSWVQQAIESGEAWLERGTKRLRQLSIALSNLQGELPSAAVPIGMMSSDVDIEDQSNVLQVSPVELGLEIRLVLTNEPESSKEDIASDEELCKLDVAVTFLQERFGDFSGVTIRLQGKEKVYREAVTDVLGKVSFGRLPRAELETLTLIVLFPNTSG
ncbi:hypothetical protein KFU94_35465 [Chloroflexi bacterium TSY]|nr:hypothetical protein [Chloroflexi bacterium TSY]